MTMKNLTRFFLLCLLGFGSVFAQSKLPACQGSDISSWNNCFGTQTYPNGAKYVGEFRDGKQNGQGIANSPNGTKYVGEFKDGNFNGQGTTTSPDGTKYVGEFKDSKQNGQPDFDSSRT